MWKTVYLHCVYAHVYMSQITVSFDRHLGPIVQREDNAIK